MIYESTINIIGLYYIFIFHFTQYAKIISYLSSG